jgi:NAD(P)-dependent dehydrogenase (short-subunit alcohol dehydrogenase family)
MTTFAAMRFVQEVCCVYMAHNEVSACSRGLTGVDTAIMKSVDATRFDQEALGLTMGIVGAVYRKRNEGFTAMAPQELASTLVFLAGQGGRRITGSVIPVDDGWSTI